MILWYSHGGIDHRAFVNLDEIVNGLVSLCGHSNSPSQRYCMYKNLKSIRVVLIVAPY